MGSSYDPRTAIAGFPEIDRAISVKRLRRLQGNYNDIARSQYDRCTISVQAHAPARNQGSVQEIARCSYIM